MNLWDTVLGLALLFVSVLTPFELGFLDVADTYSFGYSVANGLVDVVFWIDIVLRFLTVEQDVATGAYVTNRYVIAKRYVRGAFFIDVLASIPMQLLISPRMRMVRMMRIFRLFKLMRLLRVARVTKHFQERTALPFLHKWFVQWGLILGLTSHWLACALGFSSKLHDELSWVDGYATRYYDSDKLTPWQVYLGAVYWSVMTLTSIGYGDVVPESSIERVAVIVLMGIGGLIWAVVLGNIAGLYSTVSKNEYEFGMMIDGVNSCLQDHGVEGNLRERMRGYLYNARACIIRKGQVAVLENLSPGLQGEYALALHTYWIDATPWLAGTSRDFVTAVFRFSNLAAHAAGEVISAKLRMHYIYKGVVGYAGMVLRQNCSWGYEQMVLNSPVLLHENSTALAMTFVELYTIGRDSVNEACRNYPQDAVAVRRAAVLLAVRTAVRYFCRKERSKRMLDIRTHGHAHSTHVGPVQDLDGQLALLMKMVETQASSLEELRRETKLSNSTKTLESVHNSDYSTTRTKLISSEKYLGSITTGEFMVTV